MTAKKSVIPLERIGKRIFLVRFQEAMLDTDLARFPSDFMFQLNV